MQKGGNLERIGAFRTKSSIPRGIPSSGMPSPGISLRDSAIRTSFKGTRRFFGTGLPATNKSKAYMSPRANSLALSKTRQPRFTPIQLEQLRRAALGGIQSNHVSKFNNLTTYGETGEAGG